jgi:hypothetical protein
MWLSGSSEEPRFCAPANQQMKSAGNVSQQLIREKRLQD